jgi:hypothetical protein
MKWNGSTWLGLGSGTDKFVQKIIFDSVNNLYLGGAFTSPAEYIAEYGISNYIINTNGQPLYLKYYGSGSSINLLYYDTSNNLYSQVN